MANVKFPFDHFHIETAREFFEKACQSGAVIPGPADPALLTRPFSVNGRKIDNSMAIQPLEGLDGLENGAPGSLTLVRYEKLAAQGAGILWVEATAICPEGRDSLRQLWLHEGSAADFRRLAQTIDQTAVKAGHRPPYKVIQLTHSGRCSRGADGSPRPLAAFASPYLDPLMGKAEIVTDDYLDQLQERFAEASALALEAGFDAVELKLCHQYLFKELLCAYTRPGRYGGTQENRFRFALETIGKVRAKLGTRIDIVCRLNAYDGIPWPYGWGMKAEPSLMQTDLSEVKELMRQLYRRGVRIFNLTTTSPRFAPSGRGYLDNFDETAETDPFAGTAALLQATREIRQEMPADLHIVGTGLSWFGPFAARIAAGGIAAGWFDIAGFGRSVMADNQFIPSILKGRDPDRGSCCIGCDRCFQLFFANLPTGCAIHHTAYQDLLREANNRGMIGGGVIY